MVAPSVAIPQAMQCLVGSQIKRSQAANVVGVDSRDATVSAARRSLIKKTPSDFLRRSPDELKTKSL